MHSQPRSWYGPLLGQASKRRRQVSSRPKTKYRRRAFLEALETRQVLTVPLPPPEFPQPQLDHPDARLGLQGWLFISAASSPEHDNRLTISRQGSEIHIHDALLTWQLTDYIPGASLSDDQHTLIVPEGVVYGGQILINGGDGNDTLTVDFLGGNPVPAGGLTFNGGAQTSETGDVIQLNGDTAENITYRFLNKSDGSVEVDGALINYTGLEPLPSNITAANVDLFYSDASETITITDFGGGQTQVNSTAGEVVNFPNPTGRLVVHAGGGDDTVLVHGVGAGLSAKLIISGGFGNDTVTFGDSSPIVLGGSLSVAAETINQTQPLTVAGTTELAPSDYASEVLRDNPAAYYRLNETSGTTAAPLVGTINGVYVGGITLGDVGPLVGNASNYAPIFDGSDDFVQILNGTTGVLPASLFSDGTYSVEIWFRSRNGANTRDLVAFTSAADNNHGILLETVGTRQLRYLHRSPPGGSGGQHINPSSLQYVNNTWNHLVVVNDGAQMRLYLNGIQDSVTAVPTNVINFAVNVAIGRIGPSQTGRNFDGGLDEFAVYDHVLTETQIQNHLNSLGGTTNITLDNPANDFVGAVTVASGGTVLLSDANNLALGPVEASTALTLNAPGNITQTAPITGAGSLTKLGPGVLELSVPNLYAGSTTIRGGTVRSTVTNGLPTTTAVILGVGADTGVLDLDADQTIASLAVTSNTADFNTVDIAPGQTLNINAGGTTPLSVGVSAPGQITNVNFIGGGHLNVTNTTAGSTIFFGLTNTNQNADESDVIVNMTDLGSFTASVDNIRVGYNSRVGAVVSLSNTENTITANLLSIGDSTTNNAGSPIEVILGTGTNLIQVNTLDIAAGKGTAALKFASQAPGSPGTVTIWGRLGELYRTTINLGVNIQVGTGANIVGTLDLRGHEATVQAGTLTMGRTNQGSSSGATGTVWFDNGTFSANHVTMANRSGGGSGTANGNLNIGGGVFTVRTGGSFVLGTHIGGGASNGTINLTGGTLISQVDITDAGGTTTTTINLNGGTLDMAGNAIGGSVPINAVNLRSGTLQNVGAINATTLAKITADTVQILGDNSFTTSILVNEGVLQVDGTMTESTTPVQSGATLTGTGTMGPATINNGGTHSPGNGVGIQSVSGDYVQRGSLVIEIASPSGTEPGTSYDQVRIMGGGSVNLDAADLVVNYLGTPGTFNPPAGVEYIIIENDGSTPSDTAGSFLGLPNGSTLDVDGMTMQILYNGGDGNDVVLRRFAGGVTTLYVNDQFTGSGTVDGDLEEPGTQSATIGVTAFASIEAALTAHPDFNGVIVVNGGTYASNNEPNVVIQNLTGDGVDSIVTRFHDTAGGDLTVAQGDFGGVIAGGGSLTKTTTGVLTLSGPSTYAGSTTIVAGTVTLGANNSLPPTTVVTVGSGTTTATLDLDDYNLTIGGLLSTSNSTTHNVITIAPGRNLTVNGDVTIGLSSTSGSATDTRLTVNGGGALSIVGTTVEIGAISTPKNAAWFNRAVVDLTELGSFTANVTSFRIGYAPNDRTVPTGNLLLSNTANTIIANALTVGDTANNNGNGESFLILGTGTNVLRADTIYIGRGKNTGRGTVRFESQAPGSPGTVTINNKAGTGKAAIHIGHNNTIATAGGAIGTLDLRGHVATVSASSVTLGVLNMTSNSGSTSGTLRFDAGTFAVDTLNVAPKSANGTGTANGLWRLAAVRSRSIRRSIGYGSFGRHVEYYRRNVHLQRQYHEGCGRYDFDHFP
jgi:autotransporter-associated beta strand protein